MADSKVESERLIVGKATISHIRCLKAEDGKSRFQFLHYTWLGREVAAVFAEHPDLCAEVKRYDNRFKDTKRDIRDFMRQSSVRRPKRIDAA